MKADSQKSKSLLSLISSMFIFGTIGIFVKFIPLPSDIIAMARGFIGAAFLLIVSLVTGKKIGFSSISKKDFLVFLSGAFIGINWILLFESYRYTSVATATLGYYMAPVFVILLSPVFLKEKLTFKKIICVLFAVVGMVFVSGVLSGASISFGEIKGILLSISAAAFYATVIIMNKKTVHIPAFSRTLFQLFSAAVVLIPYSFAAKSFSAVHLDFKTVLLLFTVGIIHTGVAYAMYFGSMKNLSGDTIAIFSYIDPVTAIVLSAVILPDEKLSLGGIIGAILILGAALLSELDFKSKKLKKS